MSAIPTATENEQAITVALRGQERGDAELAEGLWTCYQKQYYRVHGYRTLAEYLRERWRGREEDAAARVCGRTFQRLIREHKLAMEIPAFKAAFNAIQRANRRLIVQYLTVENADELIALAKRCTTRELELALEAMFKKSDQQKPDRPISRIVKIFPAQLAVYQQALDVAGQLIAEDGGDPECLEGIKLEMLSAEFLATYQEDLGDRGTIGVVLCPACGRRSKLLHEERAELSGRTVEVYRCGRCAASVAMLVL